ncbi:hypothetical protein [Micromonospora aurantiaca (nom. illeg.)]
MSLLRRVIGGVLAPVRDQPFPRGGGGQLAADPRPETDVDQLSSTGSEV